jgi:hypothetical protein
MTWYEDGQQHPVPDVPGGRESSVPNLRPGRPDPRVELTPQEVAALLQGLSQAAWDCRSEPAIPAASPAPAGASHGGRRRRRGWQKISHWWAAATELQWPQL